MEIRITKRLFFDALFASLLGIFMLFMPATANAQKSTGKLKAPSHPTRMDVKDRTISDLLYFPLSCIETPMPTREKGMQVVTDTFGNSESIMTSFLKRRKRLISFITISLMTFVAQASRSRKTKYTVVCRTARSLSPSLNGWLSILL